ncbi:type IV toxin-antitoxin system AbiEi family antitoxin domain-containing protein [Kribbella catacumbae]|uniref:type IV toxin-antitoxin system AbiEi family antitoxin domain-containing protein n=1 Tax=Kribbella catacumbae TaxID=460086 RepID=UPI00035EB6A6|nr:type IV toxin-antitoxin system AbiEi family antitoxin domain-containing protein [Kribbella catacumbae]
MPEVTEVLARRQGTATFAELRAVVSGRSIRNALLAGQIRRSAKGVYTLPDAPVALATARSHGGVVSHLSAAQHWGMKVITEPLIPHVTLPPGRARRATEDKCVLHWADAPALNDVTTPIRTVLDCIRAFPLAEALAVADSALHQGIVDPDDLFAAAAQLRGPHRRRIQEVAALADARSESVLESALRAILIQAGIDGFEPQVAVRDNTFSARLDLGNRSTKLGLEADGFEHHGTRQQLVKDCRRGVNLAIRGWTVLRFSWEDIMYDQDWVAASVAELTGSPPHTKSHLRAA